MARVTVEDCLAKVENRFVLVHLASERARQLKKGALPLNSRKNKEVVLSLREIAGGQITYDNVKNFEPTAVNMEDPIEINDDDDINAEL